MGRRYIDSEDIEVSVNRENDWYLLENDELEGEDMARMYMASALFLIMIGNLFRNIYLVIRNRKKIVLKSL